MIVATAQGDLRRAVTLPRLRPSRARSTLDLMFPALRQRPFARRRTRLRLTVLALLALLFQQAILTAYACQLPSQPQAVAAASMATMPGCTSMQPDMPHHPADQHGLCTQHCAQQPSTQQDARLPSISALVLPPQPPFFGAMPLPPARSVLLNPQLALREPPPRPSCALLI